MTQADEISSIVAVTDRCIAALLESAIRAYPDECCGALIGEIDGQGRFRVDGMKTVNNRTRRDPRASFAIEARDLTAIDCRDDDRSIVGFFHSHPDGRPFPSATDVEHASPWPGYLQAIIVPADDGPETINFFISDERDWTLVPFRQGHTDA